MYRPTPQETTLSDEQNITAVETALSKRPEIFDVQRSDHNEEPTQARIGKTIRGRYPEEYDIQFIYGDSAIGDPPEPQMYPMSVVEEVAAATAVDVEWRGCGHEFVDRDDGDSVEVHHYSFLHIVRQEAPPLPSICRYLRQHDSVSGAFWRYHWRDGQVNWWLTDPTLPVTDYNIRLDLDWNHAPRTVPSGVLSDQVLPVFQSTADEITDKNERRILRNADCVEVGERESHEDDNSCFVTAAIDLPVGSLHFL